jgi:hypothetical protein
MIVEAIDFESLVDAFRINWLILSVQSYLCGIIFNKLGGLEFLMKCDFDPHQQMLFFWKMIFKYNSFPP